MPAPCSVKTSRRLQRVLSVLADGQPHSTAEIVHRTGLVAVDTAIRELRGSPNDLPIARTQRGHIHTYTLGQVARLNLLVAEAARLAGEV